MNPAGSPHNRIPLVFLALLVLFAWGCGGDSEHGPADTQGSSFSFAALEDPPIAFRPWVRWWWPGGDVDDEEIAREVTLLAEGGFGGAEIQPFDAALDPAADAGEVARRLSFDTPAFYAHLRHAMQRAREAGLPLDLNLASGWPAGGMHVAVEDSLRTLLTCEHVVAGPGPVHLDLRAPDRPVFYGIAAIAETFFGEKMARFEGEHARRVAVTAARVTGGARSTNPFDLNDTLELDPGSVRDLTARVGADGVLGWEVPEGRWVVIAFFDTPDGEYPMLNAQPEPGYVLDHLDLGQTLGTLEHLLGPRTGLEPFYGNPLRGIFNDSLELKTERLFAGDFLQAFAERRGYDLRPWLPAVMLPGADNSVFDTAAVRRRAAYRMSAEDARIRYDYLRTVSDLFIERFVDGTASWAAARGLLLRAQNYGANIDTIRAAGATGIPEAEQLYAGGSEMFLKLASSGALLYDRPLVSAESLVWIGRAYMITPLKIKAAADKLFTAGVNHVVYHGFPYAKNHAYGETGWHPFASPHGGFSAVSADVSASSPFWSRMPRVNRYVSRCQYALRRGRPAADVLVYYPWMGFPTTLAAEASHEEPLFNGRFADLEPEVELDSLLAIGMLIGLSETDPRTEWLSALWPVFQRMESRGYTWAWVNDEGLAGMRAEGGDLVIGDRRFGALMVPDAPTLRPAAAGRVAEAASAGAAVLLLGRIPSAQPGFHDHANGDAAVTAAMARAGRGERVRVAELGEAGGRMLADLGVVPAVEILAGGETVRSIRRELPGRGRIHFFRNTGPEGTAFRFRVREARDRGLWVDAWAGTAQQIRAGDDSAFEATLPGYGSALFLCGIPGTDGVPEGSSFRAPVWWDGPGSESRPLEAWTLTVRGADVPGGAVELDLASRLPDWREVSELRYVSSPGVYATTVRLSEAEADRRTCLRVAWVHGAADVRVNGRHAGSLLAPPYEVDLTGTTTAGDNRIEIEVTPALRNRLEGRARAGDPLYRQYPGSPDMLLPAGIEGPVSVRLLP